MASQPNTDPHDQYIDGEWVSGNSSHVFKSENPATGEPMGTFYRGSEANVDSAIEAANTAFEDWRSLSYIDRAEFLWEVFVELRERTDELGRIVTNECGKEISEGKADVIEAAHMVEWAAGNARHPHGDVIPSEIASKDSFMRRKPRGVVGCITPWNFPIAIPFWHMAITLVEGNTVVWKPAEQTPLCAHVVAEIMDEVGMPPGVFNLVQGYGETGAMIVDDDRVGTILFTGSAEVGHEISDTVGGQAGRIAACEMGGKNAIVITDSSDLELAVHAAIMSSFKTTGQRCVSSERLIVHSAIYEPFKDRFLEIASDIAVGDPLDEETFMGPAIESGHLEKIRSHNELAVEEGANVLLDRFSLQDAEIPAGCEAGHWVGPFVYEIEYDPAHRCLKEECFGPHVALIEYEGGIEEAIEIHNDTPYGLAGAVISEDYREINHFRDHADLGLAYANLPCIGAEVQLPFGGVKRSGNGSPSARETIESVTDRTAWTVNNSSEISMAQGLSADIHTTDKDPNS